ncbi:Pentatricopeptide repeat-containing protein [Musa troglodytarum]|uniref:Pentatricopeptide repeat-containing protein n=1 Tax=Musa troglodytarum TaxID=320322 RepID=A0A9E7I1H1_9LILI|nr:Pentatricopeptide repeat-containing protein [Musa troglodytarum]
MRLTGSCSKLMLCNASSSPTTSFQAHLLSLLRECRTVDYLKQIHSLLITSGLSHDVSCNARILRLAALFVPGDIAYASLLFHQTESPTVSMWNAMVRGHSLRCHHGRAIAQYTQMLREGVVPDEHTYPLVLKVLPKLSGIRPDQVHAQVLKFGYCADSFVRNSLVAAYAKCSGVASARNLFDGISDRDPVPWTAMIQGYVENDQASDALAVFVKMRTLGVHVDEVAIVSVLKGCGLQGNVWLGRCVHGFYVACGRVKWDVYVGSALVDMYAKCGCCDDARELFDEMPLRNVVTWSTMITGYVQCGRYKNALSLFRDMLLEDQAPNEVTMASVLTSCAQTGALGQGRWIHGYVKRSKLESSTVVGTALVDMYAKCGCIDEAVMVFSGILQKDVYPWTALINGLAIHGYAFQCLDLFSRMVKDGVQPNEVTFIGVLSACSHRGLVDQGRYHFSSMFKDYSIRPKVEHYGCMVDLLGRAGMLEEAMLVIESMPMEPTAGVWGAVLNACIIHEEFDLGERVGKHLIEMDPRHSGRYALLANLYSLSNKWDDDASVRMSMKGRRVEKIRGSSWTEVNGILHEFFATDESHPETMAMYEMLDGMTKVMKLNGACS